MADLCFHDDNLARHLNETDLSVCCCSGPMCNENFLLQPSSDDVRFYFNLAIVIGGILVIAIPLGLIIFLKRKRSKSSDDEERLAKDERLLPQHFESNNAGFNYHPKVATVRTVINLDLYRIDSVIGEGSFSIAYKAIKSGDDASDQQHPEVLVVKEYKPVHKGQFYNEKAIYDLLLHVENPHILRYYGSHEFASLHGGANHELIICHEYNFNGALESYLKLNTITWSELCKMLMSISQGLAFLHTAIKNDAGKRLSVCHRNLGSSNIYVKEDLTCCIGNFGAAAVEDWEKSDFDASSDAGNVRYQAPELLESFLNCSLKQCDIYALGLIFWEASRRCHELYQGVEVPPFEHCFEKEIGLNPCHEQMKILVAKHRARPLFPEVWKDSNPAIQLLKETIMDSWDHDGEARLTSWCVVERVRELEPLWEKYKLVSQGPPILDFALPNNTHGNATTNLLAPNSLLHTNNNVAAISSKAKNNNLLSGQRPLAKIQPHQGLNPCLERNYLAKIMNGEPLNESRLVMGSAKDKPVSRPQPQERRVSQPLSAPHATATHFVPPIPYLQNDIHASSSSSHKKSKNHHLHGKNFQMSA